MTTSPKRGTSLTQTIQKNDTIDSFSSDFMRLLDISDTVDSANVPRILEVPTRGFLEQMNRKCVRELERKDIIAQRELIKKRKQSIFRRSMNFFSNMRISLDCCNSSA